MWHVTGQIKRLVALLTVACAGMIASAQDIHPIETRNHRAVTLAFLRLYPQTSVLPFGSKTWSTGITVANDLRRFGEGRSLVADEDYELVRLELGYRQGLRNGAEWGVQVPILSRGSGFLDSIIDWWHAHTLRWGQSIRDITARYRSVVQLPGEPVFGSATGLGDISFTFAKELDKTVVLNAAVKLPTGDAGKLLGSGGIDLGMSLNAKTSFGRRWYGFAQAGIVAQGHPKELIYARALVHQEALGLVWKPNSRDEWVLQWQGATTALQTGYPKDDAAERLVTFGFQRRLSDHKRLELFFSEDRDLFTGNFPEGANIGPDLTFGARLAWRF